MLQNEMRKPELEVKATVPVAIPGRPRYKVYDHKTGDWWEPSQPDFGGKLEELTMTDSGELVLRTAASAAIPESAFPNRFTVVPHLDNFQPVLN